MREVQPRPTDVNLVARERAELDARIEDAGRVVTPEQYVRARAALSDLRTREFMSSLKDVPLDDVDVSLAVSLLRGTNMKVAT